MILIQPIALLGKNFAFILDPVGVSRPFQSSMIAPR
jgi:hypothetical protein